jgi:hypothetical protein
MTMNIEEIRHNYLTSDHFWAVEVVTLLDDKYPQGGLEWVKTSLLALLTGQDRAAEATALKAALACDDPGELKRLAEPLEGDQRDALSLAVANFLVGKSLYLNGNAARGRFFLNAALRFIRNHCQSHHLSPEFLFDALSEKL